MRNSTFKRAFLYSFLAGVLALFPMAACDDSDGSDQRPTSLQQQQEEEPEEEQQAAKRHMTDGTANLPSILRQARHSMDATLFFPLDGGGPAHLAVAVEWGPNVVIRSDGNGGFTDVSNNFIATAGLARDSEDVVTADFNGDGMVDLLFVSEDEQGSTSALNELYLSDGSGGYFEATKRLPVQGTTNAVAAFDFDRDGDIDIMLGNYGQNNLFVNDGQGQFTDGTADLWPVIDDLTQDIDVNDIDGDRDWDVLVGNEERNYLLIYDGSAFNRVDIPALDNDETREADFGDIDGDGDLDIFFANVGWRAQQNGYPNRLLRNDGGGAFVDISGDALPPNAPDLNSVDGDFVDIDNDGDLDLVIGSMGALQVFINDGTGKFADQTTRWIPASAQGVNVVDTEFFDFDGDGLLDIYVCCYQGGDKLLIQQPL